jgi:hypothetical protein
MAVAQRLRLLSQCRSRNPDCQALEVPNNVVFDPASRLFSPFFSGEQDPRADQEHAAALLTTYLGYLRWQQAAVLDAEAHRLQELLARLLAVYTPQPQDIRLWADARRDKLALSDFWLPADRVVGVDLSTQASVSAAFTLDTWRGVIAPLLHTATRYVPTQLNELETARAQYFSDYFHEWAQFVVRFGEGVALWKGQYDQLIKYAASPANPYTQLHTAIDRHLLGLPLAIPLGTQWAQAWASTKQHWLGAWKPLGSFIGAAAMAPLSLWIGEPQLTPPAWLLAQTETTEKTLNAQDALFTRGYLQLQNDSSGLDTYNLTADLFRARGAATQGAAADYAALLQAVDKPEEKFVSLFHDNDLNAWSSIAQGPARLLLFLTVQRAAQFVQNRWTDSVVTPLSKLTPKEQNDALYGEQGRLAAFVKDWLQPFITERERTPIKLADIELPLSASYQNMVAAEQQVVAQGGKAFLAGSFQFSQPSQVGLLPEGPQGTLLQVVCSERSYTVSTQAESLAAATAQVYWPPEGCVEARLQISLPLIEPGANNAAAPTLRLSLIYAGQSGFTTLLDDFRTGSHLFRLSDFRQSYGQIQWEDLSLRLTQAGFATVRVFLDARPTEDLRRALAANNMPATLPASILD